MDKFCYRCGAIEEEKGPLIEGLCQDCFLGENALVKVPEQLDLKVCNRCGAYLFENKWHDMEDLIYSDYTEAAKEMVTSEVEVLQMGPTGTRYVDFEDAEGASIGLEAEYSSTDRIFVELEVQAKISDSMDEPLGDRASVEVRLVETTCEVCGKISQGYYEAVLQVRGQEDLSEDMISEVFQALRERALKERERSRDKFVSKFERKHGGINFYTSETVFARDLARFLKKKYGAEMSETAELMGQTEDGEEKYRVTVLARLPF